MVLAGAGITGTGNALDNAFVVDDAGDRVVEAAGGGTDLVQSSVSFALGANVENLTLTVDGPINGTGNALGNRIVGSDGANKLDGAAGNDILEGGLENDTLIGGLGNDLLIGGGGWIVAGRALRPLRAISEVAERQRISLIRLGCPVSSR